MLDILPSWVGCRQFFVSFPNDYITCRVNSVDLKNRLSDIETNCRDRLHVWLLRIVGASTAPTSMALPCRWRSRPQHQKRTLCTAASRINGSQAVVSRQRYKFRAIGVQEGVRHCDETSIRLARQCVNDGFEFGFVVNGGCDRLH